MARFLIAPEPTGLRIPETPLVAPSPARRFAEQACADGPAGTSSRQ